MTNRVRVVASLGLVLSLLQQTATAARADAPGFKTLTYSPNASFAVTCPALYECRILLLPGDVITDADSSDSNNWEPSVPGNNDGHPALLMRAHAPNLTANFVLTARNGRSYLILAHSCTLSTACPITYYSFSDGSTTTANGAGGGNIFGVQQNARAVPATIVTPEPSLGEVPLESVCNSDRYSMTSTPVDWRPTAICTDGHHTFVQFPNFADDRTDIPTLYAIDGDGNRTIVTAPYYQRTARYVADGVYPTLILAGGSPNHGWALTIIHHPSIATRDPDPTPAPILVPGSNPYPQRVYATPPPTPPPAPSQFAPSVIASTGGLPPSEPYQAQQVQPQQPQQSYDNNQFAPDPLSTPAPRCGTSNDPNAGASTTQKTQWSSLPMYASQIANSFVVSNAVKQGAKGNWGSSTSPFYYLGLQGAADLLLGFALHNACPQVKNAVNLTITGATLYNTFTTHGPTPAPANAVIHTEAPAIVMQRNGASGPNPQAASMTRPAADSAARSSATSPGSDRSDASRRPAHANTGVQPSRSSVEQPQYPPLQTPAGSSLEPESAKGISDPTPMPLTSASSALPEARPTPAPPGPTRPARAPSCAPKEAAPSSGAGLLATLIPIYDQATGKLVGYVAPTPAPSPAANDCPHG